MQQALLAWQAWRQVLLSSWLPSLWALLQPVLPYQQLAWSV
jgi:hypothetical protein